MKTIAYGTNIALIFILGILSLTAGWGLASWLSFDEILFTLPLSVFAGILIGAGVPAIARLAIQEQTKNLNLGFKSVFSLPVTYICAAACFISALITEML